MQFRILIISLLQEYLPCQSHSHSSNSNGFLIFDVNIRQCLTMPCSVEQRVCYTDNGISVEIEAKQWIYHLTPSRHEPSWASTRVSARLQQPSHTSGKNFFRGIQIIQIISFFYIFFSVISFSVCAGCKQCTHRVECFGHCSSHMKIMHALLSLLQCILDTVDEMSRDAMQLALTSSLSLSLRLFRFASAGFEFKHFHKDARQTRMRVWFTSHLDITITYRLPAHGIDVDVESLGNIKL